MPSSAPTDTASAGDPLAILRARAGALPIFDRLDALHASLAEIANAVLVAPPGAGKTTAVAPSLIDAPWLRGRRILMMLPRRLAARAAAERIAALLGEEVGHRVGYRTRLEMKIGRACRIECITEGIFVNRIVADPELADVGMLIFDEVHERNRDGDFGLALALDAQGGLRDDMRILAMSATLDGARFARLMGNAPVIESAGRQWPLVMHHVGRRSNMRMEDDVAQVVERGLAAADGSMLVFLPGIGEIERVAERLRLPPGVVLHKLHGGADPRAQRAAIARSAARKCVLATAIAETSITIDGVSLVVDAGLARRPRFDRDSGLTRLMTERASQAAIAQRAGRAARQQPGIVWCMWDEGETRARIPYDPPEILETDLAPLLLDLAAYGVTDPATLAWLDAPPAAAIASARQQLQMLGALDDSGRLTLHGRELAGLPMPPRLAHMLLIAARRGAAGMGADIALILQERGAGGNATELAERMAALARDNSPRARDMRRLARQWADAADRIIGNDREPGRTDAASLLALAYPDRVARRRGAAGASGARISCLMAGGSGVQVDATDALAGSEWIVVADAGGAGADSRLRLGAAFESAAVQAWINTHANITERLAPDPVSGRVVAERTERLGAITVNRTRMPAPPGEERTAILLAAARSAGLAALPWPASECALLLRMRFAAAHGLAALPPHDEVSLLDSLEDWLSPRLENVDRLADVSLAGVVSAMLDWQTARRLDTWAPARFETPAATSHAIDYAVAEAPEVEVRVQALFGLGQHPMLAEGRVALVLALMSPAGRLLQKTTDIVGFWRGSWADVRRDMKGRYPKHPWPEDPASALPTARTKRRVDTGRDAPSQHPGRSTG